MSEQLQNAIQTLKAGLMEIADIFAVNKSDRPGSNILISELDINLLAYRYIIERIQALFNFFFDKIGMIPH